jgi:hypothetical protein
LKLHRAIRGSKPGASPCGVYVVMCVIMRGNLGNREKNNVQNFNKD